MHRIDREARARVAYTRIVPVAVVSTLVAVTLIGYHAYRAPQAVPEPVVPRQLTWVDRAGQPLGVAGDPGALGHIALSPDETRVAFSMAGGTDRTTDLWLFDLRRGVRVRLTFDPLNDDGPVWSPDARMLAFGSDRAGTRDLYLQRADGSAPAALLFDDGGDKTPMSWSPDGRFLLYQATVPGSADLWLLPVGGDRTPVPFLQTPFDESDAQFSPDGRWVAYSSDQSGRREVYVDTFPAGRGRWQISVRGGRFPRWRRDGREIFYLGAGNALMSATVEIAGSMPRFGAPARLFDLEPGPAEGYPYEAPDGRRFLVSAPSGSPALPR
jgi:Tol biopolymer transport system component